MIRPQQNDASPQSHRDAARNGLRGSKKQMANLSALTGIAKRSQPCSRSGANV